MKFVKVLKPAFGAAHRTFLIKTLSKTGQLLLESENPFRNSSTPLKISTYDQSKHIVGGDKYIEYMKTHKYPPSIITITEEEAQNLIPVFDTVV